MKPIFEQLETRSNPAVVATFAGGILTVTGDSANNTISVREDPGIAGLMGISWTA
jgi:hypothetical protein